MTLFEKIIETNLINFLIVLFTLIWIVRKFSLTKIIDKMTDDITYKVQKSESDTKSVINSYTEVKKSVKDTNKLKDEILNNAKDSISAQLKIMDEEVKTKKQDIKEKLALSKTMDFEKIKEKTTSDIFFASVNLAKFEIENLLIGNQGAKYHKKIIQNAIEELEDIEILSSKGAQIC